MKDLSKINNRIYALADKYESRLKRILNDIQKGKSIPAEYKGWALADCIDMLKFYNLILSSNSFNKAFHKLRYLSKECRLVPEELENELMKLGDAYDWLY
jgi:hypothetical protein